MPIKAICGMCVHPLLLTNHYLFDHYKMGNNDATVQAKNKVFIFTFYWKNNFYRVKRDFHEKQNWGWYEIYISTTFVKFRFLYKKYGTDRFFFNNTFYILSSCAILLCYSEPNLLLVKYRPVATELLLLSFYICHFFVNLIL